MIRKHYYAQAADDLWLIQAATTARRYRLQAEFV